MSYRCQACAAPVPPGQPRLLHVVKRADGKIAREVAVCPACQAALQSGVPLSDLTARNARVETPQPKPAPSGDVPPPAA